jgi:lysophospholipase L1-like esterase
MLKKIYIVFALVLLAIFSIDQTASAQNQNDTIKVACVGNSITEGSYTGNAALYSYPAQLQTLLGSGWLAKNFGVSGRTLLRQGDFPIWNEQLFKDALAFNPDIVTIMLGTNDSKQQNWAYKDEFVNDYKAMIDTFRALPSQPVVWLCLPPKAFSGAYDIRDSIIITDIIPMIQQVAADKECPVIDFYTATLSHPDLFPDGIHPHIAGSAFLAEVFYSNLINKTITHIKDENTAYGRTVTASGSIDPEMYGAANLVDGDNSSSWKTTGLPSQAVVDLDSVQTIDLFELDFGNATRTGYQFLIETAEVLDSWTTALDFTARTDTAGVILEKISPIQARYVRLSITGALYPKGDTVSVAEFHIVKVNSGTHAPVIRAKKISATHTNARYTLTMLWPNGQQGIVILYRHSSATGLSAITGFQAGSNFTNTNEYIKIGTINTYYAVTFLNGVETTSDTLVVDTNPTAIEQSKSPLVPKGMILYPAYPNPFNPWTTISFTLSSPALVTLKIFNTLGEEITTLVSGKLSAGYHSQQWNASNLPSGIYFYRLQAGNVFATKKMVLMK